MISLLPTDVETDLRTTLRAVLTKTAPPAALNGLYDGVPDDHAAWTALSRDLGLAGLLVPESLGGAGASAREAAVVMEELGRSCASTPFLTSSVIASAVLLGVGDTTYLPRLASGEVTVALALPATALRVTGQAGKVRSVVAAPADLLLVPVQAGDRITLELHDTATITPVVSLDMTRRICDVGLDEPGERICEDARDAVDRALLVGAGLLAAEQVGLADWALTTTVAHLKDRRQFGRVVGGFQALKHRLADLYAQVEGARAAATYAAAVLAGDPGDPNDEIQVAVHTAAAYCSDVAVRATEEAVQLHGGLGMTWEHPAHLHLKRAKADQLILGSPEVHRARLATLIDLTL